MPVVVVEGSAGNDSQAGDVPFWRSLAAAAPVEDSVTIGGDDLLFIIYTSGTTGLPKGVPFTAKSLAMIETSLDARMLAAGGLIPLVLDRHLAGARTSGAEAAPAGRAAFD